MAYTVGEVAAVAKVSVRALHHYDEIGLLEPSGRSDAGYRLYSDSDLERLQEVLFFKEIGFGLDEIRDLIQDPRYDRREALEVQRDLIADQAARYRAMLGLIDKTLTAMEGGIAMSKEEMFEVFGEFDPSEYEDEAKDRWGDTDAYRESTRRARGYSKEDWRRFKSEGDDINQAIISLMDQGVPADDARAMDAVDRAREQIDTWFYPCSRAMHAELGKMYVADPRFTATYEKMHAGMAQYMCDATAANARRGEPDAR